MGIAKKPAARSRPDETNIAALIEKGGSVPGVKATPEPAEELKYIQVRLNSSWIKRIDALLRTRPFKPVRHTWFLEAIWEKLEREEALKR